MLDSIVDLTKARPHMRNSVKFTPAELHTYHEGYYTGVIMALRVAEEAIHRFEVFEHARRLLRRQKKTA